MPVPLCPSISIAVTTPRLVPNFIHRSVRSSYTRSQLHQHVHFIHRHHRPRSLCARRPCTHREASRRRDLWQHRTYSVLSSPPNNSPVKLTTLPSRTTQPPKSLRPSTKAATTSRAGNKSAAATTLTNTTTTKASTSASAARGKSSRSRPAEFTLVVSALS